MRTHVHAYFPDTLPSPISFVGEAPSDEELRIGRPLVGPAGRIFSGQMRTANLRREDFHITNVFEEQVPDNDIAASGWLKDKGRVAEARIRLKEELDRAKPNVIVPLGGTALTMFLGTDQIGAWRGAVTPAQHIVPGRKLVPTYHPSFMFKAWKYYPVVIGDFMKAAKEAARGPQIFFPKRRLILEPDLSTLGEWKARLLASDLLSLDIETGWGHITSIVFAPNQTEALVIPFRDPRQADRSYWRSLFDEVEAWRFVREICEAPVPKLGQNFVYDTYWLKERYGIRMNNYREDTRLQHATMFPELPKSLQFLGNSYSDQGQWKLWGHKASKDKRDD